jgi:hypothetical protein
MANYQKNVYGKTNVDSLLNDNIPYTNITNKPVNYIQNNSRSNSFPHQSGMNDTNSSFHPVPHQNIQTNPRNTTMLSNITGDPSGMSRPSSGMGPSGMGGHPSGMGPPGMGPSGMGGHPSGMGGHASGMQLPARREGFQGPMSSGPMSNGPMSNGPMSGSLPNAKYVGGAPKMSIQELPKLRENVGTFESFKKECDGLNCRSICQHVKDCPVCKRLYRRNDLIYVIVIVILAIAFLITLRALLAK